MHVVVVGCGRVGSALAQSLTERRPHRGRHRPPPEAFARLGAGFTGQDHRRHRLRPRPAAGGRHRAGRRRRRGDERRQLEHPHRPGGAGDLRRSSGWWPGSTTRGGRRSTSGSASPRWPPWRGPPSGSCGASSPTSRRRRVGRPQRQGDARRAGGRLRRGPVRPVERARAAGRAPGHGRRPLGDGPDTQARCSCSRTATSCTWPSPATRWPRSTPTSPGRPREATDARRHRRRRQRRARSSPSSSQDAATTC